MKRDRVLVAGVIYRMKRNNFYYSKKFPCAIPADYADCLRLGDCYICDEYGNGDDDRFCPVPMRVDLLGEVIARCKN